MKQDGRGCRGDSEIDLFVGAWVAGMVAAFTVLIVCYVIPAVHWM